MQNINAKIQDVLKSHKNKKQYLFVLFLLSVMVITAVCFSLMTPAISMSGDRVCTKAEHLHNSSCYAPKLVCTENTEGHSHSDDCFTTETKLVCGLEEDENHIHSEECYKDEEVLICEIPETDAHVHTDECYTNEVICGEDEHTHSANCYKLATQSADIAAINDMADDEEVFLGEATMDMQDDLIQSVAINDVGTKPPYTENGYDFSQFIQKITINEETPKNQSGNEIKDYNTFEEWQPEHILYDYKDAVLTVDYMITQGLLDVDHRKIFCQLPSDVIVEEYVEGKTKSNNGQEIGDFKVFTNGLVVLEFTQNFISSSDAAILGGFFFDVQIKKDDKNNSNIENVTIGNKNEPVIFNDLKIDKSVDEKLINKEEKTIPYKLVVSSKNGCTDFITITDQIISSKTDKNNVENVAKVLWNNGQQIDITKIDCNGSETTIRATVNIDSDGKASISGLDKLNSGESYIIDYEVKLDMSKLGYDDTQININNTATAESGKLKPQDNSNKDFDIRAKITSKSGLYDRSTGYITWTVTLDNSWGYDLKDYVVYDEMFNIATKFMVNGKADYSDIGTLNGKTFTFKSANDKEYIFTYTTKPTPEDIDNGSVNNIAILKKNDTEINRAPANVSIGKLGIVKSVDEYHKDPLEWTITVNNPDRIDLNGYVIRDIMFSDALIFKYKWYDLSNDNGILKDEYGNQYGKLNGNEFIIDYYYNDNNTGLNKKEINDFSLTFTTNPTDKMKNSGLAQNTAELYNKDNNFINSSTTKALDISDIYKNSSSKKCLDVDDDDIDEENGIVIIPWESIYTPKAQFDAQVYKDTLTCSDSNGKHYMTKKQIIALKVMASLRNSDDYTKEFQLGLEYTITINDLIEIGTNEALESLNEDIQITSYQINFINHGYEYYMNYDSIKISYETTGIGIKDLECGQNIAFTNKGQFDFLPEQEDSYQYNKPIPFVKGISTKPDDTSGRYDLKSLEEDGDNVILKWYILVNESGFYSENDDIELTDELPDSTSIDKSKITLQIADGDNWKSEDINDITIEYKENGKKVEFTIPASVHKGKKFKIEYSIKVPKKLITGTDDVPFDNFVYNDDYETKSTQKIYNKPTKEINKSAKTYGTNENEVTYTLDINPEKHNLSTFKNPEDDDVIEVIDTLGQGVLEYCNFSLVELNVYEITDKEIPLDTSRYTLELDEEKGVIKIWLPDETHIKVVYKYYFTYKDKPNGVDQGRQIVNDAWLYYHMYEKYNEYSEWEGWEDNPPKDQFHDWSDSIYKLAKEQGSFAGTGIQIEKIDSSNVAVKLVDAEFELFRFKNNKWEVLTGIENLESLTGDTWADTADDSISAYKLITTKGNLICEIPEGEQHKHTSSCYLNYGKVRLPALEDSTLYKIVETKAPNRYDKSIEEYYFAYDAKPDASTLPEGVKDSDVKLFRKGGIIRIENTKVNIMPETGGTGTTSYVICGIALMSGSGLMYFCIKRRRRRIK